MGVLILDGFSGAAIDAGGDITLGEVPTNSDGWSMRVFSAESEAHEIILKNCGIVVSGDSRRYLDYQGVRYYHILDPETGYGVTHERKVTVIVPSAVIADAWTSVYSVMAWEGAVTDALGQGELSSNDGASSCRDQTTEHWTVQVKYQF